jgi:flagellar basal body-associated protein FliL
MGDIDFSEGGEAPEAPAPEKKASGGGGLPILKILMFVGIVIGAIALVITVVVVTVNIMDSKGRNQSEIPVSEEYQDVRPIYVYSSSVPEIRTRTADQPPALVSVKIEIGYDKGNKAFETEMGERGPQIQDFLRNYFSSKTSADLRTDNEETIKEELREKLNDMMKAKGVRDILFETLDVAEM